MKLHRKNGEGRCDELFMITNHWTRHLATRRCIYRIQTSFRIEHTFFGQAHIEDSQAINERGNSYSTASLVNMFTCIIKGYFFEGKYNLWP